MRRNWKYLRIWLRCNCIYIILLILAVIDVILFLPMKSDCSGNVTSHAIINLGFHDAAAFAAILMGLATVAATVYTNNQNLKVLKFSSMPNAFQLKTNLEYEILFYQRFAENGDADELITFVKVFSLFLNNRSNFRLIAPDTYDEIIFKVLMYKARDLDRGLAPSKDAAVRIIRNLGKLILMDGNTELVPAKDIESFDEYWDDEKFGKDYELKITKREVGIFIEGINDEDVCKETLILYDDVLKLLRGIIDLLDAELELLNS